ncbi:FAD-dependent monooxygenase [Paenibacillus agricola]|uniref:NAD(P)-binding protein n=1 Tax=Paenibacillus agricola TaxID=2716264 RepID=A0ABX0J713_9BACL|nr:FAD-dependent monooxygenase [Paenibacillus agricola]NHN30657.1 NAD(P)-binding protein [Paenibacillus agricola]
MERSRPAPPKVLVIGAGIGGLCAAIALQDAGWQVSVYERSSAIRQAGAGIVLAANAMKVLQKLGVADQVRAQGAAVGKAEIRTWQGKLLVDLPTKQQSELYGTFSYIIHRAALQAILMEQLGDTPVVQFNKKLVSWKQERHNVTVKFADGSHAEGDLLIGADGIRSVVRQQLLGAAPLRYSGFTALRGISDFADERYPMKVGGGFEAWGPGKRFGYTHLGGGQIYWFAAINSPAGIICPAGVRKQVALGHLRGWVQPIEAVIAATHESSILSHDIYDSAPVRRWTEGRVALLGDAAHPMLPNLGQGGAQAMEDAWVLAQCLQEQVSAADVPAALQLYEQQRIPRTTKVVVQSRRMARLVQMDNAAFIGVRNLMLRMIPASMQIKRLDWLVGHDV